MELLKLNFDTDVSGASRTFIVEVPYQDGIVATSEFCPAELLGTVDLMAAIRGESLDKFMSDCRLQMLAMSKITDADSELDLHIGALMALVMDHFSRCDTLSFGDLLLYVDSFCLLLKSAGFDSEAIKKMYPRIVDTIIGLYPDYVTGSPDRSDKSDKPDRPDHSEKYGHPADTCDLQQ